MKFTTSTTLLTTLHLALTSGALATPASAAQASCGSLGVMSATDLKPGVDAAELRACADHPVGSNRLAKRDCYFDAAVGCTDGYCWKQCGQAGSGQWCWTALNGGGGDWIKCNGPGDCSTDMACGYGDDCDACGCSC